jgi:hypothetical protein
MQYFLTRWKATSCSITTCSMYSISFYCYVLVNRCLSGGHPCSVRFTHTSAITVLFTSRDWDHWPSVSRKCVSCQHSSRLTTWPWQVTSVPGAARVSHPLDPATNVSKPWYLRLISDVNAYISPYQLLEVPTHQMAVLMLHGFKEAWKGIVTLRLRHRTELRVALILLSYSWWLKCLSSRGDVAPMRVACSTRAFKFVTELPFQQ